MERERKYNMYKKIDSAPKSQEGYYTYTHIHIHALHCICEKQKRKTRNALKTQFTESKYLSGIATAIKCISQPTIKQIFSRRQKQYALCTILNGEFQWIAHLDVYIQTHSNCRFVCRCRWKLLAGIAPTVVIVVVIIRLATKCNFNFAVHSALNILNNELSSLEFLFV